MQAVRNGLFYFAPFGSALLGGLAGFSFHWFAWVIGALVGFGAGCAVSGLMIVLSIRAKFKSDAGLARHAWKTSDTRKSD